MPASTVSTCPGELVSERMGGFVVAATAGAIASGVGIWVTLTGSGNSHLISNGTWLGLVGGVAIISLAAAVVVYLMGMNVARRVQAAGTP